MLTAGVASWLAVSTAADRRSATAQLFASAVTDSTAIVKAFFTKTELYVQRLHTSFETRVPSQIVPSLFRTASAQARAAMPGEWCQQ